jgi:GTP-binding protein
MPFQIAIVGKTNVGKSTLLNMLARKKFAITSNEAGVTRDRKEVKTEIAGRKVILIDTAGLEQIGKTKRYRGIKAHTDRVEAEKEETMYAQMIDQSLRAINMADIVLFVIDALNGVTEEDYYFAEIARKYGKKIILIINKAENEKKISITAKEIYKFGFKDHIFTSAEHAIGITDILLLIKKELSLVSNRLEEEEKIEGEMAGERIHIAVLGRPNAGKSTLVNKILGTDRVITGDKAGITRDSISIDFTLHGRAVKLVDTAGIRKNNDKEHLEKLSIYETSRSLRLAHIALLLLDAKDPFVQQDLSIAGDILKEGRVLIIVINKADLLSHEELIALQKQLKLEIGKLISDILEPEFAIISALNGEGLEALYRKMFTIYDKWNTKIKTNALNNWLKARTSQNPPPLHKGREVRLKYAAQTKIRPPTFVVFANKKEGIPASYLRFLSNSIIKDFNLTGIMARVSIRASENPYEFKVDNVRKGIKQERERKAAKKKFPRSKIKP